MVMFTIALIALLTAAIVLTVTLLLGGVGFIVAFGDLIIFGLIVYALFRIFKRRK